MGKVVDRHDKPRMAVLAIGWFEIAGYYYESFLPYIKFASDSAQIYAAVAKHAAVQALNVVGINIRMAYNISGMLASSFQPEIQD